MKDPRCYATQGCPGVQNSYDSNGRVQWQKDQLNRQTSFGYGSDQTTLTDPKANVTVLKYQTNELIARIDGYGTSSAATTYYTYDLNTLGVASITDPNSNVSTNTYDAMGNLLTQTDALGRSTTSTYDAMNGPADGDGPAGRQDDERLQRQRESHEQLPAAQRHQPDTDDDLQLRGQQPSGRCDLPGGPGQQDLGLRL